MKFKFITAFILLAGASAGAETFTDLRAQMEIRKKDQLIAATIHYQCTNSIRVDAGGRPVLHSLYYDHSDTQKYLDDSDFCQEYRIKVQELKSK